MAYTDRNFKSKKALREALAAGETITYHQPGGMFSAPSDGEVAFEGPHYPEAHEWYARCLVEGGKVVKVIE